MTLTRKRWWSNITHCNL